MEGWNTTWSSMPNTIQVEVEKIVGNSEFTKETNHDRRNFFRRCNW